jgi:hypothetical protein
MSEMARLWVRRSKRATWIWDEVVHGALQEMPYSLERARRQEYVPFYTGLEGIVLQSMIPIAEEAGMGRRMFKRHFFSEGVIDRLSKDHRRCPGLTPRAFWRTQFRKIHCAIVGLCKENAPQHLRHAELLTLCEFNCWHTRRERKRLDEFSKGLFPEEFRKRIGWD